MKFDNPTYHELKAEHREEFVLEVLTENNSLLLEDDTRQAHQLLFENGNVIDPQVLDWALSTHSYEKYLTPRNIVSVTDLDAILAAISSYTTATPLREMKTASKPVERVKIDTFVDDNDGIWVRAFGKPGCVPDNFIHHIVSNGPVTIDSLTGERTAIRIFDETDA